MIARRQLQRALQAFSLGGPKGLAECVISILASRGKDPKQHTAQVKAMCNHVIKQHYSLSKEDK